MLRIRGLMLCCAAALFGCAPADVTSKGTEAPARDAKGDIQWWRDARYGLFVHYGPFSQYYEWCVTKTLPGAPKGLTPEQHKRWYVSGLKPNRDFARHLVAVAKAAGMKYIVFTAKHHEGFSLWDSKLNDYNSVRMGPGFDMVAEYVKACREAGLGVGLYYSLWDFNHPDGRSCLNDPAGRRRFLDYTQGLLRELMTNYGKIDIVWYDGPTPLGYGGEWEADQMNAMIRKLQPGILINNRSMKAEDFMSSENHINPTDYPGADWEACLALRPGLWTWFPDPKMPFSTVPEILDMLQEVTRSTGNLLLNVGPSPAGCKVWGPELERLTTVGQWLARNGEAVYGRVDRIERLGGVGNSAGGNWTRKGNTGYLWLPKWPADGQVVLTNVHAKITACSILGTGAALKFEQTPVPVENDKHATRVVIRPLPKDCPDPVRAVLKIQFDAYPE